MRLSLNDTDKEYFLLVNHPDLLKRAEELGYQGVSLYTEEEYDEVDIAAIKKAGKPVVRIKYSPDKDEEYGGMSHGWLRGTKISGVEIELSGNKVEEDKYIRSLEDAIKYFPTVDETESRLRNSAIIMEKDYTGRCGNCREYLGDDDKYCRYCGTERGKGKFLPFLNETYCVYGPPIKKKYKCTACGHIWISSRLGGDNAKFCPHCGKKTLDLREQKVLDFGKAIGFEEPYDNGEEPILFEEDQVESILNQRKEVLSESETDDMYSPYISRETILDVMRKAGMDIPADADYDNYPRTEAEGERINLAETILCVRGENYSGHKKVYCHHCRSSMVAALGYIVRGKGYEEIAKCVHVQAEKDALVYDCRGAIDYDSPDSRGRDRYAYICLSCGTEFGKFEMPKEIEKIYKMHLAKIEAEKVGKKAADIGKNAVYAAVGLGAVAVDAARKMVSRTTTSSESNTESVNENDESTVSTTYGAGVSISEAASVSISKRDRVSSSETTTTGESTTE